MNKIIYSILFGTVLLLGSCSGFTDIKPKGKNLLTTVDELELLLNQEWTIRSTDLTSMAGDYLYTTSNIPNIISSPNITTSSLYLHGMRQTKIKWPNLPRQTVTILLFTGI